MTEKRQDKEAAEMRMLFEVKVGDIQFIKRQQWTLTYYVFAFIAAILGFHKLLSPVEIKLKFILGILIAGIACMGTFFIDDFRSREDKYRATMKKTQETFVDSTQILLAKEARDPYKYEYIPYLLRISMWLGAYAALKIMFMH